MIAIIERVISSASDKLIQLSTSGVSRPMTIGTDWDTIRVGIRLSFNLGTWTGNLTGTPKFSFGVCNNAQYEIFSYTTVTHMLGMLTNVATMTPGLSGGKYQIGLGSSGVVVAKKVATTITTGAGSLSATTGVSAAAGQARSCFWFEIAKGSPNFTLAITYPTSAAGAVTDMSESELFLGCETSPASIPALGGNFAGYQTRSAVSFAVDESTDGEFNGVYIDWNRTTWSVEVSDVAVYKVS